MSLHHYCITYMVCGTHYHFRCSAPNKREAKKIFTKCMGESVKSIVEIEVEDRKW